VKSISILRAPVISVKGKETYRLPPHLLERFLKANRAGNMGKSETIYVEDKTNPKAYLL